MERNHPYKWWKRSFKFKIYMNFLAISVITVIVMNVVVFQYFTFYMKKQINEMSRTKLENISTVYNHKLEQYRHIAELIYKTPKFITYIYDSADASPLGAIEISNSLRPILKSNEPIGSIFFFQKDKIIYELDEYYIPLAVKQQILAQVLTTRSDRYPLSIAVVNGEQKLVFFQTSRETLYGKSQDGVVVILDTEVLRRNILSSYDKQSDDIFIVDNETGEMIISENRKYQLGPQVVKHFFLSNPNRGSYSYSINGNSFFITQISNENEGYSVISVIDNQISKKELLQTRNRIIFFAVAVILLVLYTSYFLTNKIYRPINHMFASMYSAFKKPEHSGEHYDEIQEASLVITKAASQLSILESKHHSNEMIDYLNNGNRRTTEIPQDLIKLHEEFGGYYQYRVISMELEPPSGSDGNMAEEERAGFLAGIGRHLILESGLSLSCSVYPIRSDHLVMILTQSYSSGVLEDPEIIRLFNEHFLETAASKNLAPVYMGVSGISDDFRDISDGYRQSLQLVRNRLFFDINHFLSDTFAPGELNKEKAGELSRNTLELIKHDPAPNIPLVYVNELLHVTHNVEYEKSMRYLANLIADAMNLTHNVPVEDEEYRSSYLDIYLKLQSCGNRRELTALLHNMLESACLELKIAKSKTVQHNILLALEYINDNLGDNSLSIDFLAEKFKMSPSYFSKMFNSFTQKTFPDYLNQLRLQKAAELLVQKSDATIHDIAHEVGFNSNSYFAAAFKKKFGMSPSKFRMNRPPS